MVVGEAAAGGMAMGIFAFIIIIWGLMILVGILGFIFWIFMLIDVAKRNFKNENDKIIWILVVILASWVGALIYYFVIKKPNKN